MPVRASVDRILLCAMVIALLNTAAYVAEGLDCLQASTSRRCQLWSAGVFDGLFAFHVWLYFAF